jgi:translation initiation factor 5A
MHALLFSDTGKKYVDTLRGDTLVPVIKVATATFALLDVDADSGAVSVMTDSGEMKEDANLGRASEEESISGNKWDSVGMDIILRYEAGESLKVTVFSALGREIVVDAKTDTDDVEEA